ncbi:MAG: hypothetical protein CMN85_10525 [Spongiibacteraceae bacterium]|nr:hypothetical protein [Spongiibacteraceae bacterium]|tara:strand:+ start:7192 stop:7428 length:237 start_codon:yes stop_codon:yes gene_type:complete
MSKPSPEEIRALQEYANGHYIKVVADRLGKQKRTIEFQLQSACKKLGAGHLAHAAMLAAEKGLIVLNNQESDHAGREC